MNIRKHHPLTSLPAFQRQNLLVEFASLKHSAPRGLYLTLTQNDPTLWYGFASIRTGHYRGAILKFLLAFPPTYPALPPDLMLQTRVFHPLVDPQSGRFALEAVIDGWSVTLPDTPSGQPGNVPVDVTVIELLEAFKSAFETGDVIERVPERLVVDKAAWKMWKSKGGSWEDKVGECVKASIGSVGDGWMGEEVVRLEEAGKDDVWGVVEEARIGLERRGVPVREF